jgi:hypothetical protein
MGHSPNKVYRYDSDPRGTLISNNNSSIKSLVIMYSNSIHDSPGLDSIAAVTQ